MKKTRLTALFILFIFIAPLAVFAESHDPEKSGIIQATVDGKNIEFPLLKAHYYVDIQGDLATVHLEQWFENPTTTPLNASYLFPLNKDSAIYAMQMQIGDEMIEAKIKKIAEAKRAFQQAKQEGKAASLLTQHRPNVFSQNLANLMPGKPIRVTLKYTQHVPRVDQNYELVLPLVVGPRYQPNQQIQAAINEETISEETQVHRSNVGLWELEETLPTSPTFGIDLPKTLSQERVKITVRLNGGMPIESVNSKTHLLSISSPTDNTREITLAAGKTIANRDFVLHYKLSGAKVQAGLLTHQDERGNFFSLLIEPPTLPTQEQITPREMVFVLDTSGSMNGQPLDASKIFMKHAIQNLRSSDYFRIIDFGSSPREYSQSPLIANAENKRDGMQHVDHLQASGGTEIIPAIQQAFTPAVTANALRIVVFLTDGYIGNEASVLAQISRIKGDARIYSLGVGSSVNRYLLDEMGRVGKGFARYIDPTADVEDTAIQFAKRLETPVMTDIHIDWGELEVTQLTPSTLPDLFVGDSLRILGKFKSAGKHPIKVNGTINGQKAVRTLQLQSNKEHGNVHSVAIPLLWARSQIADHMRSFIMPHDLRLDNKNNEELKNEVTQLGLKYSLMTKWTSFIAISNKIINHDTANTKNSAVPLAQVAGVSAKAYSHNSSASFAGSSAPEPAVTSGLLLIALMFALYGFRRYR